MFRFAFIVIWSLPTSCIHCQISNIALVFYFRLLTQPAVMPISQKVGKAPAPLGGTSAYTLMARSSTRAPRRGHLSLPLATLGLPPAPPRWGKARGEGEVEGVWDRERERISLRWREEGEVTCVVGATGEHVQ
jgi:hypothetical protein